jgi:RNA polymerase sigma factor (TIGR02999 family)
MDPPSPSSSSGSASAALLAEVYDELRRLARGHMAAESGPQTLTATALVHEAWLRVAKDGQPQWESRRHFFGAAAQAMRRILLNRARDKKRLKRGGPGQATVPLESVEVIAPAPDEELLAVDDALTRLAAQDPALAEIVSLRFFAGLAWAEIADLTGVPERELNRQWTFARAWLRAEME